MKKKRSDVSTQRNNSIKFLRNLRKKLALIILIVLSISLLYFVALPTIRGDVHLLIVLSGSMEPSIHIGDIVVSSRVDVKELKEGDIITFRYKGEDNYITHRISKVLHTEFGIFFKTKGDANENEDSRLVESNEVVGKVLFVIPYLGYLPAFARTIPGYILLILLPGVLIIVNELKRIRTEIFRKRLSK